MKILFIYPPYKKEEVFSYLADSAPTLPPLGLAYLAAYLRKHSYDVSIIDSPALGLDIEGVVSEAISQRPQLIAITTNSPLYSRVLSLSWKLKEKLPNTKIVLGGYHPTFLAQEVLANDFVDFIIKGEGEKTLLELCKALEGDGDFSSIKGLGFRQQEKIVLNEERSFIKDLDNLPFPAYDLLPLKRYYVSNNLGIMRKVISLIVSRGCTGRCYFCTSPGFWKNIYRKHSPEYCLSLMNYLHKNFKKDCFQFRDDTFTLDKNWVMKLCSLIIKNKYKYKWDCYSRFDSFDEEMLKAMKKAGCYQISLGVESANDEVLKRVKGFSKKQVYKGMEMLKKYQFKTRLFFMVGPPARNHSDIEDISDFALKLNPDILTVTATIAYPGSRFYSAITDQNKKSIFAREIPKVYEGLCDFDRFDKSYIRKKVKEIYRKFYLRPSYIIKRVFSIKSLDQLRSLFIGGLSLMKMLAKSNHVKDRSLDYEFKTL